MVGAWRGSGDASSRVVDTNCIRETTKEVLGVLKGLSRGLVVELGGGVNK